MRLPVHDVMPPIELQGEEEQALVDIADRVVRDTIRASDDFVASQRVINSDGWRVLKGKEGIHVYRERTSKLMARVQAEQPPEAVPVTARSMSSSRANSTQPPLRNNEELLLKTQASLIDEDPRLLLRSQSHSQSHSLSNSQGRDDPASSPKAVSDVRKPRTVPGVLCAGIVDGTLEDAMLSVTCGHDDFSWQWRCARLRDYGRVLAPIQTRTAEAPFQYLGLKWYLQDLPTTFAKVLNARDFLVLEASGIIDDDAEDPTARAGFLLLHSVDMARVPKLEHLNISRGHISMCFVFHQLNASSVSVFARGFFSPGEDIGESASMRIIGNALLEACQLVDFANIKKLRWLMMHDRRSAMPFPEGALSGQACKTCGKNIRRLTNLLQGGFACQVCHDVVCSKCAVVQHIALLAKHGELMDRSVSFCKECTMRAARLTSLELAVDEVVNGMNNVVTANFTNVQHSDPDSSSSPTYQNPLLASSGSKPKRSNSSSTPSNFARSRILSSHQSRIPLEKENTEAFTNARWSDEQDIEEQESPMMRHPMKRRTDSGDHYGTTNNTNGYSNNSYARTNPNAMPRAHSGDAREPNSNGTWVMDFSGGHTINSSIERPPQYRNEPHANSMVFDRNDRDFGYETQQQTTTAAFDQPYATEEYYTAESLRSQHSVTQTRSTGPALLDFGLPKTLAKPARKPSGHASAPAPAPVPAPVDDDPLLHELEKRIQGELRLRQAAREQQQQQDHQPRRTPASKAPPAAQDTDSSDEKAALSDSQRLYRNTFKLINERRRAAGTAAPSS